MSKTSKTTQLTAIEQDALRYRALRRIVADGGRVKVDIHSDGRGFATIGSNSLDGCVDPEVTIQEIAEIMSETKLPPELLSSHVRSEIESERREARRAFALLIAAAGGTIKVPFSVIRDLPADTLLSTLTDHAENCIVYSIKKRDAQ